MSMSTTLGEIAESVSAQIVQTDAGSEITKAIDFTEQLLLANGMPARERKWFWGQVIGTLSARLPLKRNEPEAVALSRALDKLAAHLSYFVDEDQ